MVPPVRSIYFCPFPDCSASFKNRTKYEIHIRNHRNEKPYGCSFEKCNKSFASQSHLKRHEQIHEIEPLKCPFEGCYELLKTQSTLEKHIKIVHEKKAPPKKYQCTFCPEQFNKHNWLQRHLFHHTQVYPYICTEDGCNKGFLLPSRLQKHKKVHRGYPCDEASCNVVSLKWSESVKHKREAHPRKFKCDACGKTFSHSPNLKIHKQIHAETRTVYECDKPNCSRYYFAYKNLKHHIKFFHEKRPFVCSKELCAKAFKTENELNDHVRYHGQKKLRKKKKKCKPTFAAKLAGCVHKSCKKQASPPTSTVLTSDEDDVLRNRESTSTNTKTSYEVNKNDFTGDTENTNKPLKDAEIHVHQDVSETTSTDFVEDVSSEADPENLSDYEEIVVHIISSESSKYGFDVNSSILSQIF